MPDNYSQLAFPRLKATTVNKWGKAEHGVARTAEGAATGGPTNGGVYGVIVCSVLVLQDGRGAA